MASISRSKVVVAGDLILDNYIWGKVRRISPEAPVPVVEVEKMNYRLGGAANVAANVAALGAEAKLIGFVGEDNNGLELISRLEKNDISAAGVSIEPSRPTTLKTRVIAGSQQVVRYDHEFTGSIGPKLETKLSQLLLDAVSKSSMLILSDYHKGLFRGKFASNAIRIALRKGVKVAVDPKVQNIKRFAGAFVITPNHHEASEVVGFPVETEKEVERAGKILFKKLKCPNILITRGNMGMSLYRDNMPLVNMPTVARQVYDVTGAGDTVIAVFSTALAAHATIEEAMFLANIAAGITVSRVGTAAITAQELESEIDGALSHL